MQVVVFRINNEQFAIETNRVQTINDSVQVTKVPMAPSYIKGLINLRGNVISLLDINLLLDIPKNDSSEENIIIVERDEELIGISVDQVDEVIDVDENLLEKPEDSGKDYIQGVINFQDRIVTLINIDKLF
ncbi:chemotaxis protein CheW [Clostridium sp. JN-9]|uniref:chemotaxis protein CheW n=1 Tax=Clostridium sp. JN-9 TaxID=2507159 RepID=UPI000FFE18A8|nr:chemotaxis protein CheW [Clostridium sp. JN-9]QAT40556.1 purine-binding chemotaxis protein CheW [Clostridium sp. JN-9]